MIAGNYVPPTDKIVHEVDVDIADRSQIANPVHLVQYDQNFPIIAAKIWREGNEYVCPEGTEINLRYRKPDNMTVYDPALGLSSDRKIVYLEITPQMTSTKGIAYGSVEIMDRDGLVGTGRIIVSIEENPVPDERIKSSEEFKTLIQKIEEAEYFSNLSKSWAVDGTGIRSDEKTNNSKYWSEESEESAITADGHKKDAAASANASAASAAASKNSQDAAKASEVQTKAYLDQTKEIAQSITGLAPMGTIPFEQLPTTITPSMTQQRPMYNISNDFVSDSRFKDGGGKPYAAGSNVYLTSEGKWDVLASSGVYGVKGNDEHDYRQGFVNIKLSDIVDPSHLPEHIYLTRAEYDALPDTKLTDGKIYMITDQEPADPGMPSGIPFNATLTLEGDANGTVTFDYGKVKKMTVSIPGLGTLQSSINSANTEIANIKTKNTSQDTEISNVKTKNESQDTEIANIKSKNTTQDTDINNLKTGKVGSATIKNIVYTSSLPSDAASHTDTLYLIPG